MLLTILGSGTCVPSLKRSGPSNYIKIGTTNILVDCGPGTLLQLEKAKIDYKEIDIVCITHYHTDHIADFFSLVHALNWTPGFDRKKELIVIGPKGFLSFFENKLKPLLGTIEDGTYSIVIKEITNTITYNHFTIDSCKTNHSSESIAYKFTEGKKCIVISGDTGFDERLINFSKNADLLVLECSFGNNAKRDNHLTPKECGEIAKEAQVKKLVLTHLYLIKKETRLLDTRKIFSKTVLAKDLMTFNV